MESLLKKFIIVLLTLVFCFVSPSAFAMSSQEDSPKLDVEIHVNIPARQLRVFQKNKMVFEFPVAVGERAYKTPTGPRELSEIVWNPWWIPPDSDWAQDAEKIPPGRGNPLGVVKMYLGNAILFHGTNKEWTVGRAASHGCMRMYNRDAKKLAWWIQKNYTSKNQDFLPARYRRNRHKSFYIRLENPIPVHISYDAFEAQDRLLMAHPDVYWQVGNRLKKAVKYLVGQGYDKEAIDQKSLKALVKASRYRSVAMPLKEIVTPEVVTNTSYVAKR